MQRVVDEAAYVLTVLQHMRDEASANPDLYEPDAQNRIDEAIARVEDVLRQAEFMICSAEPSPRAA
jgi:hypothetical protein